MFSSLRDKKYNDTSNELKLNQILTDLNIVDKMRLRSVLRLFFLIHVLVRLECSGA